MQVPWRRGWIALAVIVGAASACVLVFLVLHDPGPAVPADKTDSMTMSPSHVRPGGVVTVSYDRVVNSQLTDTLFFTRWDDGRWSDTHLLASGTWSPLTDRTVLATMQTMGAQGVTSSRFSVLSEVPAGEYLVCDVEENCGLLTVD